MTEPFDSLMVAAAGQDDHGDLAVRLLDVIVIDGDAAVEAAAGGLRELNRKHGYMAS